MHPEMGKGSTNHWTDHLIFATQGPVSREYLSTITLFQANLFLNWSYFANKAEQARLLFGGQNPLPGLDFVEKEQPL